MASLFNPTSIYGILVVAAAALREAAKLHSFTELLVRNLDPAAFKGPLGANAREELLYRHAVGGSEATDYMLVLATQLNVEAERLAVRSPAVRRLRAKLDPDWSSRHSPSHGDAVAGGNVSRETSHRDTRIWEPGEEETDPGTTILEGDEQS